MNWFKFYGQEFLTDPKMLSLTAVERSLWLTMLCLASNTGGVIEHIDQYKIMMLTNITPLEDEWSENEGFLEKFERLSMITIDNKTICIINYEKRQNTNLSPYERVKRHREKRKEIEAKKSVTNDNVINDNNRIDKNRIDKNIKESRKEKNPFSTLSYLLTFPSEDFSDIDATEKQIRLEGEKAYNYCKSKGKVYKDYKAFLRNWILKTYKKKSIIPDALPQFAIGDDGIARRVIPN